MHFARILVTGLFCFALKKTFKTHWIDWIFICIRYCFLHELEHFDFSQEIERVVDLLTDEENTILLNMVDKCENLEFANDSNFDACDYAFELEKCWKKTDPEVIIIIIIVFMICSVISVANNTFIFCCWFFCMISLLFQHYYVLWGKWMPI